MGFGLGEKKVGLGSVVGLGRILKDEFGLLMWLCTPTGYDGIGKFTRASIHELRTAIGYNQHLKNELFDSRMPSPLGAETASFVSLIRS